MSIPKHQALAGVFLCLLIGTTTHAGMFGVKFGPVWPREVVLAPEGTNTALDAGIEWGKFVADMIGIGGAVDFQWNRYVEMSDTAFADAVDGSKITRSTIEREIKRYLVPLTGWVAIDPMADQMVHPVLKGHFGVALMPHINQSYDNDGQKHKATNQGVYLGFYGRVAADAHINLGTDLASVFIGADYQWANMRKRDWDNKAGKSYFHQDMSGFGIHIGLRLRT